MTNVKAIAGHMQKDNTLVLEYHFNYRDNKDNSDKYNKPNIKYYWFIVHTPVELIQCLVLGASTGTKCCDSSLVALLYLHLVMHPFWQLDFMLEELL